MPSLRAPVRLPLTTVSALPLQHITVLLLTVCETAIYIALLSLSNFFSLLVTTCTA